MYIYIINDKLSNMKMAKIVKNQVDILRKYITSPSVLSTVHGKGHSPLPLSARAASVTQKRSHMAQAASPLGFDTH